ATRVATSGKTFLRDAESRVSVRQPFAPARVQPRGEAIHRRATRFRTLEHLLRTLDARSAVQTPLFLDLVEPGLIAGPGTNQRRRHLAMKLHAEVREAIALDHIGLPRAERAR